MVVSSGISSRAYAYCVENVNANNPDLDESELSLEYVRCVSAVFESKLLGIGSFYVDIVYLIFSASLVFIMQAGFAMLCAGCVRKKNIQNTMLKNLLDTCGAALGFYSVGYAFAYGGSHETPEEKPEVPHSFIGNSNFFLLSNENDIYDRSTTNFTDEFFSSASYVPPSTNSYETYAFWIFQFGFAATTTTIVAGTLAERCQMTAYLCYSVIMSGFVYPVIVRAVWSPLGFLSPTSKDPLWESGILDFAGSGVVHTTGGLTALIATLILGPRKGRFKDLQGNRLEKPSEMKGHSVGLQMMGTLILWFGWYGFNCGSTLAISTPETVYLSSLAAVNTTLAAASGCVSALFANFILEERYSGESVFNIVYAMNGCLSGLVGVTAGCAVMEPWAAILVGLVSGLLYITTSSFLISMRVDDAVDAIPVHLSNGIWGMISVGLFASPTGLKNAYGRDVHVGWFYSMDRGSGDAALLACQIIGVAFIMGWIFVLMTPFFMWLNYMGWFRSNALEEIVGLDISYHGVSTYTNAINQSIASRETAQNSTSGRGDDGNTNPLPPAPKPAHETRNEEYYNEYGNERTEFYKDDNNNEISEYIEAFNRRKMEHRRRQRRQDESLPQSKTAATDVDSK